MAMKAIMSDPAVTELTRFFKLFPNKRLALDMFSILESARVEARVMHEYRGMVPAYGEMRRRTLKLRPEMTLLPAREALLEFIVRLSLGQTDEDSAAKKALGTWPETFARWCSCSASVARRWKMPPKRRYGFTRVWRS